MPSNPKTVLITTTESMAQTDSIAGVMPTTSTRVNSFFVLNGSMALNKSISRPRSGIFPFLGEEYEFPLGSHRLELLRIA